MATHGMLMKAMRSTHKQTVAVVEVSEVEWPISDKV